MRMGRRALLENKNMKKAINECTNNLNEFYLTDKLLSEIFKEYKEFVLKRDMCLKTKAAQFSRFKSVENRGPIYLSKYITRILNYSKDFLYTRGRNGRPSHFERINDR